MSKSALRGFINLLLGARCFAPKEDSMKTKLWMLVFVSVMGCGEETERPGGQNPGPMIINPPPPPPAGPKGRVTRCLGASCPRGECGFSNDCSAYDGFDALDSSAVCAAATGARELCLKYEVPRDDGYVDIFEQAISCADVTVVKRSCTAGCGYNYQPDDCVICNEGDGCVFN